jgi:hypothetical protein
MTKGTIGSAPAVLGLVAAIFITRVEHFGTAFTPPDATLAAVFLAGLWIPRGWAFPILLAAAGIADQLAFRHGVSSWCVTAAYLFLIPAYGCLWWAGRASRGIHWRRPAEVARGTGNLLASLAAAFVISNASFFLLSGYFPTMTGAEYWTAVAHYFVPYASWPSAYVGAAVLASEAVHKRAPSTVVPTSI